MSRIIWSNVAQSTTTASILVDSQNELTRNPAWHVFVSGTLNGATVSLEYTPATQDVSDANATWFLPTALTAMSLGDTFFWARPRKFRVIINGGGASTSVTVEVRA